MDTPPSQTSFCQKLVELILRRAGWLLGAALVLTVLAIGPARRLTFDHSIESLYAERAPRLHEYRQAKAWFGGDDFVFIAYTDPDLMTDEGLERVEQLTDQLSKISGVVPDRVQSLSELMRLGRNPLMRKRRERLLEFGRGVVLGEDNQTTAIMLRLESDDHQGRSHGDTLAELRRIAAEQPRPTYVVGEPVLVHDMFRYAEDDGAWMGWAASGLLTVVIMVFLRDLRAIVLPFVIVQVTIVWTKAILASGQMQLTMVSSILGFLVLATSHFVPLIYFGLLVSVAIAGGLLINLILLPPLLELCDRDTGAC